MQEHEARMEHLSAPPARQPRSLARLHSKTNAHNQHDTVMTKHNRIGQTVSHRPPLFCLGFFSKYLSPQGSGAHVA